MKNNIPKSLLNEVAEYDLDLITPPATILDIGANIGAFTLRCARRWPNAKITAYEPMPSNAMFFRENCDGLNVELIEAAVRSTGGARNIYRGDRGVTHSFHQLGRQTDYEFEVACVGVETLPPADLIKIDTEGCEVEILERLNIQDTTAVVCEYHRAEDVEKIKALLAEFDLVEHKPDSKSNGILKFARPGSCTRKKTKLFIGLPIYAQVPAFFMQCLLDMGARKPCEIELRMCQGDGIARSRNQLTADFLKSDCTHLLFIDCDLIFSPDHVARIMSHDEDVVGGFYPKKQEGPLEWVINTISPQPGPRADGLQQVGYIGTGFMCVKRCVIERMVEMYPEIEYTADYGNRTVQHDIWQMGVYQYPDGTRRYLSEDWYFCQRWLEMGGKVFADTRVILKHIGPAVFPLITQTPEIANPRNTAPKSDSDHAELRLTESRIKEQVA